MGKKYYWLQLKEEFFRQKEIKLLRKIAGGDTYTVIYLKMMLMSLKDEGKILFEGVGNTFAEEVALEIDEDIENVEITIQYLLSKGLMQVSEYEGFMSDVPSLIGSETDSARRVRKHRELKEKRNQTLQGNEGALQSNNGVTKSNTEIDIELEIEQEIDKEQDTSTSSSDKDYFSEWWDLYPNKKGKEAAQKKFEKLLEEDKAKFEDLINGVEKYKLEVDQKNTPKQYIKHPTTWLNQGCWLDDYDIQEIEEIDKRYDNLPI